MSNTNYDVEKNISYNNTYRHYIPTYGVRVLYYKIKDYSPWFSDSYVFNPVVSFDDQAEQELNYVAEDPTVISYNALPGSESKIINATGIYSKIYFRNPHRDKCTFNASNCAVFVQYSIKAAFEVQWNSVGFAANHDAWFKCSTVPKNTYKQYEWVSATVYYKKSEESTYQTAVGTVSGSWSDVRIDTDIDFEDGYVYDVYIRATSDDNSTAQTPVGQFTTTDEAAVATCISPAGAFVQGEATFVWSHATAYGTQQYAYDLEYSINNGSSWTVVESHNVTTNNTRTVTLTDAGVYLWRVRTYNSNDVVGEWASATFVNNVPANPPANLSVNTKGRPTVEWASVSQTAYQVQFLLSDSVVYDSGAVYTSETSHFVNHYFDDSRSYVVRLRIYNALGEISEWVETGYQQTSIDDVEFTVTQADDGGAKITIVPDEAFTHYYILRNNKPIASITGYEYTDKFAVGLTNYSVIGVTSEDQSDIQTNGFRVTYPHAALIDLNGQIYEINKRVNEAYEIQTSNQADINKANFIGDALPTHYPSKMRLKSFTVSCFDDQGIMEGLLGTMVFYADNFENGGWCMVTAYDKTDNFIQNSQGIYANEVSLTLEVTNYDDSIEYPL